MSLIKNITVKKTILAFSLAALFLLCAGYETRNYLSCFPFILAAGFLIFRCKGVEQQLEIPFSPSWFILAALFTWAVSEERFLIFLIHNEEIPRLITPLLELPSWSIKFITLFIVAVSAPSLAFFLRWFWQTVRKDLGETPSVKNGRRMICAWKAWGLLFLVYFLGISALIRSNFLYVDDFFRNRIGTQDWENFSRFLSCDLSTLFQLNTFLTDLSPLTQYVAIAIVSLSGIILLYVTLERTEFTIWEVLTLIPLGLNPFFLECLSYKFDSPYMAVSVFSAIFPLLFRKKSPLAYIISVAVGSVMMFSTYQASSGIFPMIVVLLALRMFHRKEQWGAVIRFCLISAVGYCLGFLYFRFVQMLSHIAYGSTELPGISEFLPNFILNLKAYLWEVRIGFPTRWENLCILLFFAYLAASTFTSQRSAVSAAAMSAVAFLIMLLLTFGLYPALVDPEMPPRSCYGFGVLLTLLAITAAEANQNAFFRVPGLLLSLVFFSFSFTYGNALAEQKAYTEFRTQQVIADLSQSSILQPNSDLIVQIEGDIGYPQPILYKIDNYPILSGLVPIYLQSEWVWGVYPLTYYYQLPEMTYTFYGDCDLRTMNLPVVADSIYNTIRFDGKYLLITLK